MLFDKLHHHGTSAGEARQKKSSNSANAGDPPVKPSKAAPATEAKEYVYFSSRSGHRKTKVKTPVPPPPAPSAGAASGSVPGSNTSDATTSRRQSTVASLVNVAHNTLPGRKRNNSTQGSAGNSTIWGSTSGASSNSTNATAVGNTVHSASESEEDIVDDDHSYKESFARLSISEQPTSSHRSAWWDQRKISETVTPEFISSKIGNVEKLRNEVAFGDGLTSTTYSEWILHRAKKFFLILVDLSIAEQIFNVIDNSWDDNDLPIAAEAVKKLKLQHPKIPREAFEWKFLKTQRNYHLRFIHKGTHLDYEDDELVPLDVVPQRILHKTQPFAHHDDRVTLPRHPNRVLARKRFVLGDAPGTLRPEYLLDEIEEMRSVSHDHIVRLYSSFTFQNHGYFLLYPAAEMTLKTFLSSPPTAFKKLAEDVRRFKLLDWMHCLADALAYLYDRGIPHRDIRPKSIVIEERTGRILFADIGNFRHLDQSPKGSQGDSEYYIYAAPELWQRSVQMNLSKAPTSLVYGGGRTGRKSSDPGGAQPPPSPRSPLPPKTPKSPTGADKGFFDSAVPEGVQMSSHGTSRHIVKVGEWVSRPQAVSDVFSLGCIFLDMLTFHSKKKSMSQFEAYRSKRNRAAGSRGGGQPDSSFHKNLESVANWIKKLKQEAADRDDDAVQATLVVCAHILQRDPEVRPTPREVCDGLVRVMKLVRKSHCELVKGANPNAAEDENGSLTSWGHWSSWDDMHEYGRTPRQSENFNAGTNSARHSTRAYSFSSTSSGTVSSGNHHNNGSESHLSRAHSTHSRATFGEVPRLDTLQGYTLQQQQQQQYSSQATSTAPPSSKPSINSLSKEALRKTLATDIPVSPRGTFGELPQLSPRTSTRPASTAISQRSKVTSQSHPASIAGSSRHDDRRFDESSIRAHSMREVVYENQPPSPHESALLDRSGSESE